jgi:hypothetical protein
MLDQAVEARPPSRMAFEYRMALFLINRRAEKVVENLPRVREFGYEILPTLWEEAVIYYQGAHPDKAVDLQGYEIRPGTRTRFALFVAELGGVIGGAESKSEADFRPLAQRWGTTYFYYALTGHSEPRPGWRIDPEGPLDRHTAPSKVEGPAQGAMR